MAPNSGVQALGSELFYRLLSRCFQQPPASRLQFPVPIAPALATAQLRINTGLAAGPVALRAEFQRLFIEPGGLPALPVESAYRNQVLDLPGDSILEIDSVYTYFGFQAASDLAADHIARQLHFMSHLYLLQREDRLETGEARRTFLESHLLPWVPRFCADLAEASRLTYYQGLAELTAAFLQTEASHVGVGI